jgi:hypothetical protein
LFFTIVSNLHSGLLEQRMKRKNVFSQLMKIKNQKNSEEKNLLFVGILKVIEEKRAGSGSVMYWYGSADPEPYQNVTDSEH